MIRKEVSGLHLYDKLNGLHILFDEIKCNDADILCTGPRQLSIMLTKKCNLSCSFCYAKKGETEIDWSLLLKILDACQKLSVLDLTLGGGEPTMYSKFEDLVNVIHEKYEFGLSVTTNGLNIEIFKNIKFKLSKVRVSLDNMERQLTLVMQKKLQELQAYQHVGINLLYSPNSHEWVWNTIEELKKLNITDILIIPERLNGDFILGNEDWLNLEKVLEKSYKHAIEIKITSDADEYMTVSTLKNAHEDEFLFLHIDDDGKLKEKSWADNMSELHNLDTESIMSEILNLNPRRKNENLE